MMYVRRGRARAVGLALGLPALAAIILVSHIIPDLEPILVPVGIVGVLIALGVGVTSRKPSIDDAALLRRYAVLRRVHEDLPGLARRFDGDEWYRIGELWEAALVRIMRQRYDCGKYETAQLLRRWRTHVSDQVTVPPRFSPDGDVSLDDDERSVFDAWAGELGLTMR